MIGAFRFDYVHWSHDTHRPPAPPHQTEEEALRAAVDASRRLYEPVGVRRNAMLSVLFGTGKWEDDNTLDMEKSNSGGEGDTPAPATTTLTTKGNDGDHDTIGSGRYTRSCRLLLQEYDDRGSFFICVDLTMAAVCGGIQGASVAWTSSYENCSSLLYAALGVLGVYWLIAVLRRPFRYGYVSIMNVLITSLEIASVSWELYRTLHPVGYDASINRSDEERNDDISHAIVYAGLSLVGLKLLMDVMLGWYGVFRCCCTERSDHGRGEMRRRVQQRKREIDAARKAKDASDLKEFLRTTHMVDDELTALAEAVASHITSSGEGSVSDHDMVPRITQLRLMWSLSRSDDDDVADVAAATDALIRDIRRSSGNAGRGNWKFVLRKCDTVEDASRLFVDVWRACHKLPVTLRSEDDSDDVGGRQQVDAKVVAERGVSFPTGRTVSMRKLLLQEDSNECGSDSDMETISGAHISFEAEGVAFRAKAVDVEPGDPQDLLLRNASLARIDLHFDSDADNSDNDDTRALDVVDRTIRSRRPANVNHFRSSRALLEHVTSEDVNYSVAPGVSRNAFLRHQHTHSPQMSKFSPHDAAFSRHLYKFEEI
jgi:hypothetical protein